MTDGPFEQVHGDPDQVLAGTVSGLGGPQGRTPGYRKIGFGQCGIIFEKVGANHVVKLARKHFDDSLWVDFTAHYKVSKALELSPLGPNVECRVPKLYSYVPRSSHEWWSSNIHLFPDHDDKEDTAVSLPAMVLVSERIPSLPKTFRDILIDKYCPAHLQSAARSNPLNEDCLARVYLGKRREPSRPLAPNFTLRNFNLHLDQVLHLGLPVSSLTRAMGEALAFIHWEARIDGFDIEFVLGSDRERLYVDGINAICKIPCEDISEIAPHSDFDSMIRTHLLVHGIRLWVLDFNLCAFQWKSLSQGQDQYGISQSQWTDAIVGQLVAAFFQNDPYYPLPPTEGNAVLGEEETLWSTFERSYLEVADKILEHEEDLMRALPQRFIQAVIHQAAGTLKKG